MPNLDNFSLFQLCCLFPAAVWLALAILIRLPEAPRTWKRIQGLLQIYTTIEVEGPIVTPSFRIDWGSWQLGVLLTLNPRLTPAVRDKWSVEQEKTFDEFSKRGPDPDVVKDRLASIAADKALEWFKQHGIDPILIGCWSCVANEEEITTLFPCYTQRNWFNCSPPPPWTEPIPDADSDIRVIMLGYFSRTLSKFAPL